jgi:hypothetical protein
MSVEVLRDGLGHLLVVRNISEVTQFVTFGKVASLVDGYALGPGSLLVWPNGAIYAGPVSTLAAPPRPYPYDWADEDTEDEWPNG